MTNQIGIAGNVTLGASMVVAGSSVLSITATSTMTSNGFVWPNGLTLGGTSQTYTLADNWTVTGNFINNGTTTLNGTFNMNVGGNLTINSNMGLGTSTFIMNGTGTWSGAGAIANNLTFNSAGTITISGTVKYNTGTLLYTAGTMIVTSSTLNITGTATLNTSGMAWNNITTTNAQTLTNSSLLTANGNFTTNNNSTVLNGSNINVGGNMLFGGTTTGTATIVLNGTGTLSSSQNFQNQININTAGTITFSGTLYHDTGKLTYISGTVNTGTSIYIINGYTTSLDTSGSSLPNCGVINNNGINFYTVLTNNCTINQVSNLTVINKLVIPTSSAINGGTVYINGSYQTSASYILGTSTLVLQGTGTIDNGNSSNADTDINFTINTTGKYTFTTGRFNFKLMTFTYISGTVDASRCDLFLTNTPTLFGMKNIAFRSVNISGGDTVTMDSFFQGIPSVWTTVVSQASGTKYNVTFTNTKEQLTKFVKISDCNLTQPGRLNVLTINGNRGGNTGIRYYNQDPNTSTMNVSLQSGFQGFQGWVRQY